MGRASPSFYAPPGKGELAFRNPPPSPGGANRGGFLRKTWLIRSEGKRGLAVLGRTREGPPAKKP